MVSIKTKNLIVGAGLSGATMAYKIATELNEEVVLIDKRQHISGNCYDYFHETGVCVHQYGTHIFHTNNKQVWDFLTNFTNWYAYSHVVRGMIQGKEVPIPFNLNSIHTCFDTEKAQLLEKKLVNIFGMNQKVPILKLREVNDGILNELAEFVYENVFLHYTLKQWGMKPEDLDPSVTGRVPVYISRDNRYFQDLYQGVPVKGYTTMVENMINHPNIKVLLNTKFDKNNMEYERLFYTGPIDEFFDYQLGKLPYRSLRFVFQTIDKSYFQSNSCINYPNENDYTRIGEYKYFLNAKTDKTVISYEYPQSFEIGKNERYYPIAKDENEMLYIKYQELAKKIKNVHFFGRLGDYKYYDMDNAVERALNLFKEIKNGL